MNTNYKFSVSPVWAERIENTAKLLELAVFGVCVVCLTALLGHHLARSLGLV